MPPSTPTSQSYVGRRLKDIEDQFGPNLELITESRQHTATRVLTVVCVSARVDVLTTGANEQRSALEPFIGMFCAV